jgi:2-polyprenyl-3-methyl-5-hydroxy-6-metoxy-1,4-benzoquinol methylase
LLGKVGIFLLDNPVCEVCFSSRIKKLFIKDGLTIVKCKECGFCFVFPQENHANIAGRYDSSEYFNTKFVQKFGYGDYDSVRHLNEIWFRKVLQELEQYTKSKGSLLDIGCALGHFLVIAQEKGWVPYGLERSDYAYHYCQKHYQFPVFNETVEDYSLKDKQYQVITMFDVLEHVLDIRKAMESATKLLEPSGILIINTPNEGGLSRKLMRRYWFHFKPYEHTYYFSAETLTRLLDIYGFKILRVERCYKIVTVDAMFNRVFHYNSVLPKILHKLTGHSQWKYRPFPFPTGEITLFAQKR